MRIRLTVSLHWPHPDVQTWSTDTTIKTSKESLHIKGNVYSHDSYGSPEEPVRSQLVLSGCFRDDSVVMFAGITHVLLSQTKSGKKSGRRKTIVCFCDCDLDSTHSCFLSADLRTAELSDKSSFIFKLGEFFHVEKKLNSRRKITMFLCDAVKLFKAHLQSWNKLSSHHCDENKDWKHEGSS